MGLSEISTPSKLASRSYLIYAQFGQINDRNLLDFPDSFSCPTSGFEFSDSPNMQVRRYARARFHRRRRRSKDAANRRRPRTRAHPALASPNDRPPLAAPFLRFVRRLRARPCTPRRPGPSIPRSAFAAPRRAHGRRREHIPPYAPERLSTTRRALPSLRSTPPGSAKLTSTVRPVMSLIRFRNSSSSEASMASPSRPVSGSA